MMLTDLFNDLTCKCGNSDPLQFQRKHSFILQNVTYWVARCKKCNQVHVIPWEEQATRDFEVIPATIADVIDIANKNHDGHFMIFKFTTCWKGAFGTLNIDKAARTYVGQMPKFKTLQDLINHMLSDENVFPSWLKELDKIENCMKCKNYDYNYSK